MKGKRKEMSKEWYPMINYELCTECGICITKCRHGVYKQGQDRPVVVYAEGCIHGCHGCGNICPAGAISYVGENLENGGNVCCCGCE